MHAFNIDKISYYEFQPSKLVESVPSIFFAHASGIPAQTYTTFLQNLAEQLGTKVYAYDMRGFSNNQQNLFEDFTTDLQLWDKFALDHIQCFDKLSHSLDPNPKQWIFMGHSLGAWISLYSAAAQRTNKFILLDPVLIPLKWELALYFSKFPFVKFKHPVGVSVESRTLNFDSQDAALKVFKKNSMFKGWEIDTIKKYISANFSDSNDGKLNLIHPAAWEAYIFYNQPPFSMRKLKDIPTEIRASINIQLISGKKSLICHPRKIRRMKSLFKNLQPTTIEDAGHHFPLSHTTETLNAIEKGTHTFR